MEQRCVKTISIGAGGCGRGFRQCRRLLLLLPLAVVVMLLLLLLGAAGFCSGCGEGLLSTASTCASSPLNVAASSPPPPWRGAPPSPAAPYAYSLSFCCVRNAGASLASSVCRRCWAPPPAAAAARREFFEQRVEWTSRLTRARVMGAQ